LLNDFPNLQQKPIISAIRLDPRFQVESDTISSLSNLRDVIAARAAIGHLTPIKVSG
jgi:hypothetical protein